MARLKPETGPTMQLVKQELEKIDAEDEAAQVRWLGSTNCHHDQRTPDHS